MPVTNNAAEVATEIERVRANGGLNDLFQLDDNLFQLIKSKTEKIRTSTRPMRPIFKVANGVKSRGANFDGGDLGRGGGPLWAYGALSYVSYDWVLEYTAEALFATSTRQQSAIDVAGQILSSQMEMANFNLDSLVAYGDGANTLGVVTNNAAGVAYDAANLIIYVDNANRFAAGQDVDFYNGGVGTAITGTVTIKSVIGNASNALYITAAPATAPVAGATLVQNNAPNAANAGLNGILALDNASTTGTYMGVTKSQYPGQFVTPNVNAQGATLTPQIARLMQTQLEYATGVDSGKDLSSYMYVMGPAMQTAWENTGTIITQITQTTPNAVAHDTLAPKQISTIGGVPIRKTIKAIPGRIDLIDFSVWYMAEVKPIDMYSAGQVETFWPTGASGGVAASYIKYLVWQGNIGCDNPLKNAFITNLATPTGYGI